MPLESLLQRLVDAGGKSHLQNLLRQAKKRHGLTQSDVRTTGSVPDLADEVRAAFNQGYVALADISAAVDLVEENGAQHIFPFTLTEQGAHRLTADALQRAFSAPPQPEEIVRAVAAPRTFLLNRGDRLIVKHVRQQEYWETDRERSRYGDDEEVIYRVKRTLRATHQLIIKPESGHVEVRLDRVRPKDDPTLAERMFRTFRDALAPTIDFERDLNVVPIWQGFGRIVHEAKEETHLAVDEGYDHSVRQRISSRRVGPYGADIRDHPDYRLTNAHVREALAIRWSVPPPKDDPTREPHEVHTYMSRFSVGTTDYGKVYIAARVAPAELEHVLSRIRYFAEEPS